MSIDILKAKLLENKEKYLDILNGFISIDTRCLGHGIKGGLEKLGQEYIESICREIGADEIIIDNLTEESQLKALELFKEGNLGHNYDDRYNVYATFNGKEEGKSIIFNGHVDVMPPGDESKWTFDPFTPTVKDGYIYARGSVDMKSGLIASILAVKLLKESNIDFNGKVKILSVADEEGGGNGSVHASISGVDGDALIVCEPTFNEIITAHMGFVFYQFDVIGKPIHSADKQDGVSAIEKMYKVVNALDEVEKKWAKYSHPDLPAPNINVGEFNGGSAGSVVAASCTIKTCVHYLPGLMSREEVDRDVYSAIDKVCDNDEWLKENRVEISVYQQGGSFEVNKNHEFIQTLKRTTDRVTGRDIKIKGMSAGCDARVFSNISNIPTVVCGPGDPKECHTIDEKIKIDDFFESILIYASIILDWCK